MAEEGEAAATAPLLSLPEILALLSDSNNKGGYPMARSEVGRLLRAAQDAPAVALDLVAELAPVSATTEVRSVHLSLARLLLTTAGSLGPVAPAHLDRLVRAALARPADMRPQLVARALGSFRGRRRLSQPGQAEAESFPLPVQQGEGEGEGEVRALASGAGSVGELIVSRWVLCGELLAAGILCATLELPATRPALCGELGRALIAEGEITAATGLAKGHPTLGRELVDSLIVSGARTSAVKVVKALKFKVEQFPRLVEMQAQAQIRWCIREHNAELAEGMGCSNPETAMPLAQGLLQAYGPDDPVTRAVVHRLELAEAFPGVLPEDEGALLAEAAAAEEGHLRLFDFIEPARLHWVDSSEALAAAAVTLLAADAVGFDTEWEPWRKDTHACALLQLASRTDAYLVDVPALQELPEFAAFLSELFASETVLLLGYDLSTDMRELRNSLPAAKPRTASFLLDMQTVQRQLATALDVSSRAGLSALVKAVMGVPLSKQARLSHWGRRPLSPLQQHYAALDALALVLLRERLLESGVLTPEKHAELTQHRLTL